MKELIDELRACANGHPLDIYAPILTSAADALESQARDIELKNKALVNMQAAWSKLRAEIAALKAQPSGVVLPPSPYMPGVEPSQLSNYERGEAQGRCDMWAEFARLNQPASGGDIFVVGYHCRDSKGIATINWLPHENAVPLMTVAQHKRILALATKQTGEVAYDVFVSRELLDLLADAEKNERLRNLKETRYWCDQYRQIARAALSANHSEQVRHMVPDFERYQKLRAIGGQSFTNTATGERLKGKNYDQAVDQIELRNPVEEE